MSGFGLDDNKYNVEGDSPTPLEPPLPPTACMVSTEPEVSCNPLDSTPLLPDAAAVAPMAKTGRAGEINCPVITCGI